MDRCPAVDASARYYPSTPHACERAVAGIGPTASPLHDLVFAQGPVQGRAGLIFNLFVLQNMTGRDSNYIPKCSIPFFVMLVVRIAIITAFPVTVTWPPDALMNK